MGKELKAMAGEVANFTWPSQCPRICLQLLLRPATLGHDQSGVLHESLAEWSQADPALGAHQHRCLELFFELLDGRRQGGLGHVDQLGGSPKATDFFDADQSLQGLELHGRPML